MKSLLVLLTISIITSILIIQLSSGAEDISTLSDKYNDWKHKYNIYYPNMENEYRFQIYLENLEIIEIHNSQKSSYQLGENQFMGLSKEEFVAKYLQVSQPAAIPSESYTEVQPRMVVDHRGIVKVRDQSACNAGWAFSVTSTVEGFYFIQKKVSGVQLSQQHLIDCDTESDGCSFGNNISPQKIAIKNGIVRLLDYPYVGYQQKCQQKSSDYKVKEYINTGGSVDNLKKGLFNGLASIAVDATNWQLYKSGVFSGCKNDTFNHYALAVGYTEDEWYVQNSWGTTWGEKGFIRLETGNTCGILNSAYYPM